MLRGLSQGEEQVAVAGLNCGCSWQLVVAVWLLFDANARDGVKGGAPMMALDRAHPGVVLHEGVAPLSGSVMTGSAVINLSMLGKGSSRPSSLGLGFVPIVNDVEAQRSVRAR